MASSTLKIVRVQLITSLAFSLLAHPAFGHDSWISGPDDEGLIQLSTGSHFPAPGESSTVSRVAEFGCAGASQTLTTKQINLPNNQFGFVLTNPEAATPVATCYTVLKERQITLKPTSVELYLKEIRANQRWQDYWAQLESEGKPWKENYSKTAIKDLNQLNPLQLPVPIQIRVNPNTNTTKPVVGQALDFQVLMNNKPLANQSLELLVDQAPIGIWYQTSELGMVTVTPPAKGTAMLRGTHLFMQNNELHSHFITYLFEVEK